MSIFTIIRDQKAAARIERLKQLDKEIRKSRDALSVERAYGKMIDLTIDLRRLVRFAESNSQSFDYALRCCLKSPLLCGVYETEADFIASGIIFNIAEAYCTGFAHDVSSALWEMIRNDSLTEFTEELSAAADCFRKSF